MASVRAQEVAEILWELKRADKVATYSAIARRAGFSAGASGRTMQNCLRTIRRDWPHLQWWRALRDDGTLDKDSEQAEKLREAGFELKESSENGKQIVSIVALEEHLMDWDRQEQPEAAATDE
ncbi:MAG: hypothetical protein GXP27_02365 [Planctomycetes bacterium]|nr:hypothetical protein [Planctomycetota bacterium]